MVSALRVLLTGAEGYIGSVLGPYLMGEGFEVAGFDTGFYADARLYPQAKPRPQVAWKDTRHVTGGDLEGFDAVVHLAELSNDPLGQLNPQVTRDINHGGTMRLARTAREASVRRFVYFSSCSVYGIGGADPCTEE